MSAIALVSRRFDIDQLTVQRLLHDSPCFRALCEDYEMSCLAFERWRADEGKARDYREMIEELEMEISGLLKREADTRGAGKAADPDRPKGSC